MKKMAEEREKIVTELWAALASLATATELGAARARRAGDPILRGRWLAIAAGRAEQRERVAARLADLGAAIPSRAPRPADASGELGTLLRSDLATSHSLAARARRVSRLAIVLGDAETGALFERFAAEALGHAAELARALALHYAREARAAAH